MRIISRREALQLAAGTAALGAVGAPAFATPSDVAAAIAAFTGGGAAEPGKIALDLPATIEDGNSVPLSITVDSPMQLDNYVSDILVAADDNPWPRVATFHFTPMAGRAEVSTRIRLAGSQNVVVIAKTSDGRLFTVQKHVEVTVGACS